MLIRIEIIVLNPWMVFTEFPNDCLSQMPSLGDLNLKGVTPVNIDLLDNPILITLPLSITKGNPCGESGQSGHGS